jgi:hypothetical protein
MHSSANTLGNTMKRCSQVASCIPPIEVGSATAWTSIHQRFHRAFLAWTAGKSSFSQYLEETYLRSLVLQTSVMIAGHHKGVARFVPMHSVRLFSPATPSGEILLLHERTPVSEAA